jgi:hypothetical protein
MPSVMVVIARFRDALSQPARLIVAGAERDQGRRDAVDDLGCLAIGSDDVAECGPSRTPNNK